MKFNVDITVPDQDTFNKLLKLLDMYGESMGIKTENVKEVL